MNKIITIGREFGSGGREVGKRVAEILQIPYYDNEIVTEIARRTKLAEEYIRQVSERRPLSYFPITTGRSFYRMVDDYAQIQDQNVHTEQFKIIREVAEQSSCVIVGRCAGYVLNDLNPLRIFVYAEKEFKLQRCKEKALTDEKLTDKQLLQKMSDIDRNRAAYYKHMTGQKWEERTNYDLCINTSYISVKQAAGFIAGMGESQPAKRPD